MPLSRRFFAVAVAGALVALALAPAAGARGSRQAHQRIDEAQDCDPDATENLNVLATTPADPIALDIVVLHDGIDKAAAEAIMSRAARSYASLNITLAPTYRKAVFPADAANQSTAAVTDLLAGAKTLVGGVRPAKTDAVLVLTNKDIYLPTGDVVGYSECIGGIRYADRAFAISEAFDQQQVTGPVNLYVDLPAKTVAHEIGHLLGARHEHANCVEGAGADIATFQEPAVCTLMTTYVDLQSRRFGSVEAGVIRAYAETYAAP